MQFLDKIQLITFDLDDTLYPEMAYATEGFRNVADTLAEENQSLSDQLVREMLAGQREGRRDVFQTVLQATGREPTPDAVQNLIRTYRLSDRELVLHPDADRAIKRFRRAGKKLAILTDGYLEAQQKKIEWLDLEPRIDKIIYTDAVGREFWKPATKGFEILMTHFDIPPQHCVYIADNELKDFAGPKQLGWQTIKVLRPDGVYCRKITNDPAYKPDQTITTLDELTL